MIIYVICVFVGCIMGAAAVVSVVFGFRPPQPHDAQHPDIWSTTKL